MVHAGQQVPVPSTGPDWAGSVYVYEAPVRLWHWINALSIVVLAVTGYFMGRPLPTLSGEASESYTMGYLRLAHFVGGYIFTLAFLVRIYWAMVGNVYARQMFYLPVWRESWTRDVIHEIKWYLFLTREPRKYVGATPLNQILAFTAITLPTSFIIISGFALYAEATGHESWQYALFGWVFDIFPNTLDLHVWHRFSMWIMLVYAIGHIYVVVREDILSRQSVLSTMFSGYRMFKDDRP